MPSIRKRLSERFHIDIKPALLNEYLTLNIFAVFIGMAAGLLALAFRYLIWGVHSIAFHGGVPIDEPWRNLIAFDFSLDSFQAVGPWLLVILPVGGLIVGLLTTYLAKEAKGHGVPEVMEAMQTKGGRLRPRIVIVKALASSICIGTGGSAGREGPIVQMGAGVGSAVGQRAHLSDTRVKVLLSCGVAGAIAATFNAPIAGVLFALELIILEFRARSFIPITASAVIATATMGGLTGDLFPPPLFQAAYEFTLGLEIPLFLLLGLIAGLLGVVFIGLLYGIENVFDKLKVKPYLKPAIGGLIIALIGLAVPHVLGVGYDSIRSAVGMDASMLETVGLSLFASLVLLMFAKIIATSLTLGSGGSGGVFAPSLFIGAMLGAAFGLGMHSLFPGAVESWGAYALVGMAAFFAGVSRATFTSIVIVLELTGDYRLILPLMLACVVSDGVSILMRRHTIYTEKLRRRGIRFTHDMQTNVLEIIPVEDAMIKNPETVTEDTRIGKIANMIIFTGYHGFPVVNEKGELAGVIAQEDVRRALKEGMHRATAAELGTKEMIVTYPDECLNEVL
ncbi:MAG: chloride channel protein, partial [Thermoplasmata archaeon]